MWATYEGHAVIVLASVLAILTLASAYTGTRIRNPVCLQRPGPTTAVFMVVVWVLAIVTFFVATRAYGVQIEETHVLSGSAHEKVRVGTLLYAAVTFFVILYLTRRHGWRVAFGSAFIGTAAAPMFFEFPFDLIIMPVSYPSIPPNPTLYRALFFLPRFMIEFSTIALLTLLPSMRITRYALYALAGMFAVFTVWAGIGFAFPNAPLPLALNIVSKILCFVCAIMLFVKQGAADDELTSPSAAA